MARSSDSPNTGIALVLTLLMGTLGLVCLPARADLDISVTQGTISTQPIAVVPFAEPPGTPTDVAQVIENDLVYSGLFRTINRNLMLEKPTDPAKIDYRNWRTVGMNDVVIGQLSQEGAGYSARFFLMDVYRGQQIFGYEITGVQPNDLRHLAHRISDMIYKQLTGTPGYFNTRIAYVSVSGTPESKNQQWQLIVADSDGEDALRVAFPAPGQPLMSPAWSPNGTQLAFVAYDKGQSAIYLYTPATGGNRKLVSMPGINGAPAWSPDGRYLAVTLSYGSNPDLYIIDLTAPNANPRRITTDSGIDTSPSWAPDGQSLVFVSDRGGSPQIYRVSAAGGQPQRLTFQGRQNLKPVFSPDGKKIAMVDVDENSNLRIALFDLQTQQMKFLTDGPIDDGPTFAPSGNVIMYERIGPGGGTVLATVSTDGLIKRDVRSVSSEVREPAWSTYLQ